MTVRPYGFLAFAATLAVSAAADAAPPFDRYRTVEVQATRIDDSEISIDGRVDEAFWNEVPTLPPLIQTAPRYGSPMSDTTEVRVVYGDKGLFVSFVCHQDPESVRAPFYPRDRHTTSDRVFFEIDANNDATTGFFFSVTPSGSIVDGQIFRDTNFDGLWDGVWRSSAKRTDDGWSAEMMIPWSTLRFERAPTHTFGINAGRDVSYNAEWGRVSVYEQGRPGRMSTAIAYTGVEGAEPGLNLEITPFISTRFALQRPPDSLDASWAALPNAGFDLKYGVTGDMTLDVAVNPDFGQAEVDPAVLNLGPFEVFFPEKRRFFLESKEIFETRFQLFYTRRLGNAPRPGNAQLSARRILGTDEQGDLVELDPFSRILVSARMTGKIADDWVLGVLTATTGPTYGVEEFSDGTRNPVDVDPTTQWSALRLRRHFGSRSWVGGMVTNVGRFGDAEDATTGGVDYNVQFRERFNHGAQLVATYDGEESGFGGHMDFGHTSRRTWASMDARFLSPHANFSDMGFMTRNNFITGGLHGGVSNAQPMGKVRRLGMGTDVNVGSSFEGYIIEKKAHINGFFESAGLWNVGIFGGGHLPQLDLFETRGNIPWEVPLHWWSGASLTSPHNKRFVVHLGGAYGEQAGAPGPDAWLRLTIRPIDRLQVDLGGRMDSSFNRPRWVTESDDGEPIFGLADRVTTNFDLRATLGILPRLSLTTFNQAFYSTAHHTEFFVLDDPQTLTPTEADPYEGLVDVAFTSLISNTIMRWEYLPGSFVLLAYTHRTNFALSGEPVAFTPSDQWTNLGQSDARHEDILFFKVMHLFGF